jgi:small subunit ribosomal protein S8
MIARIKNAQLIRKKSTTVYFSRTIESVLNVLLKAGYILSAEKYEERKNINMIAVGLKYEGNPSRPVIREFKAVSKPGKKVFKSYSDIGRVYGGLGTIILSTSKGIIDDNEARRVKAGGEVLCNIF